MLHATCKLEATCGLHATCRFHATCTFVSRTALSTSSAALAPSRSGRHSVASKKTRMCARGRAHAAAQCAVDTSVGAGADLVHVPTPRHGNVYGGAPSERNLRNTLGVFLVNCEASAARAIERGASADAPMHKQIVPSPEYVEWMMGFPANWTRVAAAQTEPARSSRPDGAAPVARAQAQQERVFRRNGMHVLMRDRSLGVRPASAVWRALSPAERATYSERARHE